VISTSEDHYAAGFFHQVQLLEEQLLELFGLPVEVVFVDADDHEPISCQRQVEVPVYGCLVVFEMVGVEVMHAVDLQDQVVLEQEVDVAGRTINFFLKGNAQLEKHHLHADSHFGLEGGHFGL
jgi:hypothetical protein